MINRPVGLRSPSQIPREARSQGFSVQSSFTQCEVTLRCPMLSVKSVLSGEEVYHFQNRTVLLKAGTFLLVPAGVSYAVCVRSRWPTVGRCHYFADTDAPALNQLESRLGEVAGAIAFDLTTVTSDVASEVPPGDIQPIAGLFNHWATRWMGQLDRVDRVDPVTRSRVLRGLERARRAMEEERSRAWSITELAKLAGQSRSAFTRSFSRVYGLAPRQLLEQLRLSRALDLMTDPELTLTALAMDCGYVDLPTFSKAFRRRFGRSPSQWRRDHLAGIKHELTSF
ncbi:MAG: AraC family transcriptional regulator [Pseudomonadota bacterium]